MAILLFSICSVSAPVVVNRSQNDRHMYRARRVDVSTNTSRVALRHCRGETAATRTLGEVRRTCACSPRSRVAAPSARATMTSSEDENISTLVAMGFTCEKSKEALSASNGSLERAADILLSGGPILPAETNHPARSARDTASAQSQARLVHSGLSQYSDPSGKSACTSIALTLAVNFLNDGEHSVTAEYLDRSVREGIQMYSDLHATSGASEHSSVEELMAAVNLSAVHSEKLAPLTMLGGSPRQGLLSNARDNPMGLGAVLSQCQRDAAHVNSYVAAVITKPPETILVLLPPRGQSGLPYILVDSHPRPNLSQGSYALLNSDFDGLLESCRKIFSPTELGPDVPELMAMMYNSFDVYPFVRETL